MIFLYTLWCVTVQDLNHIKDGIQIIIFLESQKKKKKNAVDTNWKLLSLTLPIKKKKKKKKMLLGDCLFVCLLLYVPSQQLWSLRDGQFTLPHFFLGKLEQAVNQYFVHILSLVTDNIPS